MAAGSSVSSHRSAPRGRCRGLGGRACGRRPRSPPVQVTLRDSPVARYASSKWPSGSAPDEEGGDPGSDAGRQPVAVDRRLQPGRVRGVVHVAHLQKHLGDGGQVQPAEIRTNGVAVAAQVVRGGFPRGGGKGRMHRLTQPTGWGHNEAIVAPSRRLGQAVHSAFAAATGDPTADYLGSDGYSVRSDLGGLNLSTVPKVFLEMGNMDNATDAARLETSVYRDRMAAGVAAGIAAYLTGG